MRFHILTNSLDFGDAVSLHCQLLTEHLRALGHKATLLAGSAHPRFEFPFERPEEVLARATSRDVLIHQLFNEPQHLGLVESYPGRRLMMYHNITPPEFFDQGSRAWEDSRLGLRVVGGLSHLYDAAWAMSEFSRRELEAMGYARTGVFPLLVDLGRGVRPAAAKGAAAIPALAPEMWLFVGRVAPNKRIDHLLTTLAAYRRLRPETGLLIVGNDEQHPALASHLLKLGRDLGLEPGRHFRFTGKLPEAQLPAAFAAAHAYVSMSEHEGFCAPLLEAMRAGLPVFALDRGASAETLAGAGTVLPSADPEDAAGRIAAVLGDPARREAVLAAQAARLEDFSPEAQRQRVAGLVTEIRSLPRRPAYEPRVSVVINTYNRGRWLRRCLQTLDHQTYRNFEVIVIDGPSTDETPLVLEHFGDRIHAARIQARVLSVSRNEGIARASGELVAFIDDDAVPDPHWLANIVPAFLDPHVGAAGGKVFRMNGRDIEFSNGFIDPYGFVNWNEPRPGLHWSWADGHLNTVSGNNCIFRRTALEAIQGFDERIEYYHDEADVVVRLAAAGYHTIHRPTALVFHEAARSDNRANPYKLNWFAIVKNTFYHALKNAAPGHGRIGLARGVWKRVRTQRLGDIQHWRRAGYITPAEARQMRQDVLKGAAAGLWRGFTSGTLGRPLPAPDTFLAFPREVVPAVRIALLTQGLPWTAPGGIATYTWNLARGLADLGCEVHVLTKGVERRTVRREGLWIHDVPPGDGHLDHFSLDGLPALSRNVAHCRAVDATLREIEARWGLDLVESPNWDAEGLLAALTHRWAFAVRAHSPLFKVIEMQEWAPTDDLRLCSHLEGLLLRNASGLIASTRHLLDVISSHFPVPTAQALIPLGLPLTPPAAAPAARRTILFVGRLERRKGIHTFLEALRRVLREDREVTVEIIGRDGDASGVTWQQVFDTWTLPSADRRRVRFLGEVDDDALQAAYARCTLFVAPSLYESFGLIYLEAMLHGKPVIGCDAGGIPEVVLHEQTGLVVPPGDSTALADAMLSLLTDPDRAAHLAAAGRERALAEFRAPVMAERTLRFYRTLIDQFREERVIVYRAAALEIRRDAAIQVLYQPETGGACLVAPAGWRGFAAFGPYLRLPRGLYRAEFKLWLEEGIMEGSSAGSVDVTSSSAGIHEVVHLTPAVFPTGLATTLDVYFTVEEEGAADLEFRVYSKGAVAIGIREILVTRWPAGRGPVPELPQ